MFFLCVAHIINYVIASYVVIYSVLCHNCSVYNKEPAKMVRV